MRNVALFAAGLVLGALNTLRHRLRGYTAPRPFAPGDAQRVLSYATSVVDRLERIGEISWVDKRVLEVGPGPDLATGAVVMSRGAKSYTAVDAFDNVADASPVYDALGVDDSKLRFLLAGFPDLREVQGEYDIVFSHATLEHIEDVPRVLRRLRSLAATGATTVHLVDTLTHMRGLRERDPLNILRFPDWLYNLVMSFPGAPNRLRLNDFLLAAAEGGWAIRTVDVGVEAASDYLQRVRPALPRKWRDRDDLRAMMFVFVADAV